MSGALVRRVGIFVAPCYATTIVNTEGAEERIITNPVDRWRFEPGNAGKVAFDVSFTPATVNVVKDEDGNPIGGGVPALGAMLTIIHAQGVDAAAANAVLNEIDALPDVRRFTSSHTAAAWQQIQTFLRGKGFDSIHLLDGETQPIEELAARVVAVISPTFNGFAPGQLG